VRTRVITGGDTRQLCRRYRHLRLHPLTAADARRAALTGISRAYCRFRLSRWPPGTRLLLAGPAPPAASSLIRLVCWHGSIRRHGWWQCRWEAGRLGSECEMCCDHVINCASCGCAKLDGAGLWLGAGAAATVVPVAPPFIADDTFVTGVARLTGATPARLPDADARCGERPPNVRSRCVAAQRPAICSDRAALAK
jgi:hypothetical protein